MLMGLRRGRTLGQRADERDHFNENGFVVVLEARQGAGDDDFAAELLADFADDGGGGILPGFDFAAGKFPLERQVLVGGTLGQEQKPIAFDHGADNGDGSGSGHVILLNKELLRTATFRGVGCFQAMKTFVKVLLLAALLIVAIKFSPVLFLGAIAGLIVAAVLGAVGISLLAALMAVVLALALALSPLWIPVLLVLGLISLFRKSERTPPPVTA